jgi:uncharacterized Zn-finger protein
MTNEKKSTSPTLSTLLNNTMKEYLPTPVTPASDFPQFHHSIKKENNSGYSTFSVIKPPTPRVPTPATPTEAKPYPCPECHQTFSRPHNLKSHLTTHSSERPFQVSYY